MRLCKFAGRAFAGYDRKLYPSSGGVHSLLLPFVHQVGKCIRSEEIECMRLEGISSSRNNWDSLADVVVGPMRKMVSLCIEWCFYGNMVDQRSMNNNYIKDFVVCKLLGNASIVRTRTASAHYDRSRLGSCCCVANSCPINDDRCLLGLVFNF